MNDDSDSRDESRASPSADEPVLAPPPTGAPVALDGDVGAPMPGVRSPAVAPAKRSRLGSTLAAVVAVGLIVAVGLVAIGARSDADDANDRAALSAAAVTAAETDVDRLSGEVESATAAAGKAEAEVVQVRADLERVTAESERAAAQLTAANEDLAAASEALDAVADLGEFATVSDLQIHVDDVKRLWTELALAETADEISVELATIDRRFNELVGTNVVPDAVECKQILANNGFALYILFASSVIGLMETSPDEVDSMQREISDSTVFRNSVYDGACG